MKNTLRIIVMVCILTGGTFFFRGWVLGEFNRVFASLDNSFVTSQQTASVVYTTHNASSTDTIISTTTPVEYTGPDNFLFTTPSKNTTLYHGCTYPIKWIASSSINHMTLSVFDAGTRKMVSGRVSGLPEEFQGDAARSIVWNVSGQLWPGEYFLQVSTLNKKPVDEKSYRFVVEALPQNIPSQELERFCESGQ